MKQKPWPIYHQIDKNFREYSLYSLEQRGIPNWYDALINAQRIALVNAPRSFSKTISLVGDCISNGYHHGNASLEGSINKITKDFGNSESMMTGDGFFGTPVNQSAAAARYTSLKINPKIQSIIGEYSHLNERKGDEGYPYLNLRVPVGLCNHIIGIAIGWKASILPRKIEEMDKFLQGKKANLNPTFQNFNGTVSLFPESTKTWIISGQVEYDDKTFIAKIVEIPPMLQYAKFLLKLDSVIEAGGWNVVMQNNSSEKINISIQLKNGRERWEELKIKLNNLTKVLISENLVFIKDKQVIEYQSITDYLQDFKYHVDFVKYKQLSYELGVNQGHQEYNKSKLQFLQFMLEKKRTEKEIEWFVSQFDKKIADKLCDIRLNLLSDEEVERTKQKIIDFKSEGENLESLLESQKTIVDSHEGREMIGAITKNQQTKDEVINSDIDLWDDEDYEYMDAEDAE